MADFNRPVHALLGLPLDAVSSKQALEKLERAKSQRERCFMSTPNLNFLVASTTNEGFRASVCRSDLSVADGMPLVWLARLLGIPIRERVAGSSLFEALGHRPGSPWRVFFFGGEQGAAMQAFLQTAKTASIEPVGLLYPGFGSVADMSDAELIDIINASEADFLVVSLGAAKGQEWISCNLHRLTPPVISHLGAVVNFVAGTIKRSPRWLQKIGLEWLWRIKEEPQLWRRYLKDGRALLALLGTRVLPLMILQMIGSPSKTAVSKTRLVCEHDSGEMRVRISGPMVSGNLQPLRQSLTRLQEHPCRVVINLLDCTWVDSASCGLLMVLDTWLSDQNLSLHLHGASRTVRRLLLLYGVPARVWV